MTGKYGFRCLRQVPTIITPSLYRGNSDIRDAEVARSSAATQAIRSGI